jgi:hypothetical protein
MPADTVHASQIISIPTIQLTPSSFSHSIYGDPAAEVDDLLPSISDHGILVALVVAPAREPDTWEVLSGHRRLACARALRLPDVPCEIRRVPDGPPRQWAILQYNHQRRKTFSQLMREADAIERIWEADARSRRLGNLQKGRYRATCPRNTDRRISDSRAECDCSGDAIDDRASDGAAWWDGPLAGLDGIRTHGRTDVAIARQLGLGGKDLYRQARAVWRSAQSGDVRARSAVAGLDAGAKTIHAAYKDLRRRDRFSADFRPTPYDVWSFRHDRAFGIPHPGSIPPAIIAHTLHYYTAPGGLVVDPMAGGGTTLDVCQSMGRRCLAYDLHPARPEIERHDIRHGFPSAADGCDLIFCDPPYHTMLARHYPSDGVAAAPLTEWVAFLHQLARGAFTALRDGGCLALLLAAQTEKDLPRGFGYLDHAFLGYSAGVRAGFFPERRISCPMGGAYLPQHVRLARREGRLLGQVRDLLVLRKSSHTRELHPEAIVFMQGA